MPLNGIYVMEELDSLAGEGICDPDNLAGSATRRFSYESVALSIIAVYEDVCKERTR